MNRQSFYDKLKTTFFKSISQRQFESIEAILNEAGDMDIKQLAYVLATIYHETASTMRPIEEYGKGKGRKYGKKVWLNGIAYSDVDFIYYGRGYVQTTWRDNYRNLSRIAKKLGKDYDFEKDPTLMLMPGPSAWSTIYAMNTGLFTGRKLSDYINDTKCDFENARKIINSLDCSTKIAGYAEQFLNFLT